MTSPRSRHKKIWANLYLSLFWHIFKHCFKRIKIWNMQWLSILEKMQYELRIFIYFWPLYFSGSEALQRPDSAALMANAQKLAHDVRTKSGCGRDWRVLNVLHRVASQVNITLHSGQIGWQNPFGHSLILKLFGTFWMLLDIERSFIRVRAILEEDLHAQMGQ